MPFERETKELKELAPSMEGFIQKIAEKDYLGKKYKEGEVL